jgi:hypothetical protein
MTVNVNVDPTHAPFAPEIGVTVYTTVCAVFVVLTNESFNNVKAVDEFVSPVTES